MFFGRFNFTLTYQPGSCNTKPDALSREFMLLELDAEEQPETILPTDQVVAVVSWDVEAVVRNALQAEPDPGGGPPHALFVPAGVWSQVLQWGHTSKLACHPGSARTLSFLWRNSGG